MGIDVTPGPCRDGEEFWEEVIVRLEDTGPREKKGIRQGNLPLQTRNGAVAVLERDGPPRSIGCRVWS